MHIHTLHCMYCMRITSPERGRWLCQLAQQPGARLPRRQDLPAEAVWDTSWKSGQICEINKFLGESGGYDTHIRTHMRACIYIYIYIS